MEKIFEIKIKTPNNPKVWDDSGKQEEDYTQVQLKKFRDRWAKGFHKSFTRWFKLNLKDMVEDGFLDSDMFTEYVIDGWEDLEDYGVDIKVREVKPNSSHD